jgi:hypothetical protein
MPISQRFVRFLQEVADPEFGWEYGDGTPMWRHARTALRQLGLPPTARRHNANDVVSVRSKKSEKSEKSEEAGWDGERVLSLSEQRLIEHLRAIGRRHDDHADAAVEAVHLESDVARLRHKTQVRRRLFRAALERLR